MRKIRLSSMTSCLQACDPARKSFAIVDLALDSPFVKGHDFSDLLDALAIVDLVLESPYVEGRDFDDQVHDER